MGIEAGIDMDGSGYRGLHNNNMAVSFGFCGYWKWLLRLK